MLPAARFAEIPGISPALAAAIIAEPGLDMTRFPARAPAVLGRAVPRRKPLRSPHRNKKGHRNNHQRLCFSACTSASPLIAGREPPYSTAGRPVVTSPLAGRAQWLRLIAGWRSGSADLGALLTVLASNPLGA